MMEKYLQKVAAGMDLTALEAETAITAIMAGQADPLVVAGFLTALHVKGEAPSEILGGARAMRRAAIPIRSSRGEPMDTCGTGGDRKGTFNISTASAFVVAAAGQPVAKHGNRAISSRSGSADILEALGVPLLSDPRAMETCLEELGLAFLYAPALHPAMKEAAPIRRALGLRTIFNILGPLTNPAGAPFQLVGVYEARLVPLVAEALRQLGTKRALVVHGEDGLDEISLSAPTLVAEVEGGRVKTYRVRPEDMGLTRRPPEAIQGGDANENALILRKVLSGEESPYLDVVLLNSGAALYAAGRALTWKEGVELARETILSGKALALLEDFVRLTQKLHREVAS